MKFTFRKELEVTSIATFFCCAILYALFGDPDFSLTDYQSLYISQATQDDVDISKRVGLFYRALILSFVLFPIGFYGVLQLKKRFQLSHSQLQFPAISAFSGLLVLTADLIGIQNEHAIEFFVLLSLLSLVVAAISTKSTLRYLANGQVFAGICVIAIPIIAVLMFLFNTSEQFPKNSIAWYFSCVILLLSSLIFLKSKGVTTRRFFNALLPVALFPFLLFIAIESYFYSTMSGSNYQLILMGLIVLGTALVLGFVRWKNIVLPFGRLIKKFFAPAALLSFILVAFYTPVMPQPQELFEFANPANAQLRLFEFGELPFADFMTSHMFSEQFYGYLYHLIYGYSGTIDFYVYNFLYLVPFYLLAYCWLIELKVSPFITLLILLAFPLTLNFFSPHLFYTILLFFAAYRLVQKQTIMRTVVLFAVIIGLIIWRLDSGAAGLLTTLVFLPLIYFLETKRPQLKPLLVGTGISIVITVCLTAIFAIVRSPNTLLTNLKVALHYITGSQAHGYSEIAYEYEHQFYLIHVFIPLTAVFIVFRIVGMLYKSNQAYSTPQRYALHSSLFLFLVFFMNFQRGLVRHGFAELNDGTVLSTFFLATVLFIVVFASRKSLLVRYVTFTGSAFVLIFILKYFPFSKESAPFNRFFDRPAIAQFDQLIHNDSLVNRMIVDPVYVKENYGKIVDFMDEHLEEDQTFFDFSNTPMLYYYTQRKVPSYFCQNQQNSIDSYLEEDHLRYLNPKDVPFAVTTYPFRAWSQSDGTPTTMRQPLLSEYLFANYEPVEQINGKTIWASKHLEMNPENEAPDPSLNFPNFNYYKHAAIALDRHHFNDGTTRLEKIKSMLPEDYSSDTYIVDLDESVRGQHIYLRIYIANPLDDRDVNVTIEDEEHKDIANANFICREGQKTYTILLSNRYLWYHRNPNRLRIPKWSGMIVEKVEFYTHERTSANNH